MARPHSTKHSKTERRGVVLPDGESASSLLARVLGEAVEHYPAVFEGRVSGADLSKFRARYGDLIPRFADESEKVKDQTVSRHVLRLGNREYPHMKLVLEENIVKDEFAFGVDAHGIVLGVDLASNRG